MSAPLLAASVCPLGETPDFAPSMVPASRFVTLFKSRCRQWLISLIDSEHPAGLDPRLARDIGVAPPVNTMPQGFAAAPRPLWGIGLTPQPVRAATGARKR